MHARQPALSSYFILVYESRDPFQSIRVDFLPVFPLRTLNMFEYNMEMASNLMLTEFRSKSSARRATCFTLAESGSASRPVEVRVSRTTHKTAPYRKHCRSSKFLTLMLVSRYQNQLCVLVDSCVNVATEIAACNHWLHDASNIVPR